MFKPEKIELTDCIILERPPPLCDNGMALPIHKTVTQKQRRRGENKKFSRQVTEHLSEQKKIELGTLKKT